MARFSLALRTAFTPEPTIRPAERPISALLSPATGVPLGVPFGLPAGADSARSDLACPEVACSDLAGFFGFSLKLLLNHTTKCTAAMPPMMTRAGVDGDPGLHGTEHLQADDQRIEHSMQPPIDHPEGGQRTADGGVAHDDATQHRRHQGVRALQATCHQRPTEDVLHELMHPERTLAGLSHRRADRR